jgi:hypothetical protein
MRVELKLLGPDCRPLSGLRVDYGMRTPRVLIELNRYVISAALVADLAARPVQGVRRPPIWPAFGPRLEPQVRVGSFFLSRDRMPL